MNRDACIFSNILKTLENNQTLGPVQRLQRNMYDQSLACACSVFLAFSFCRLHHCFLLSCPFINVSYHLLSKTGNLLPTPSSSGSTASFLNVSKYSSKSGNTIVNFGPSPLTAIRSCSHFFCSSEEGREARPDRMRAARTACHSKTLKVNPAPTAPTKSSVGSGV
jgi:hypothetical protein